MRRASAILVTLLTAAIVVALSMSIGGKPALGPLLNPGTGWAVNAEAVHKDYNDEIKIKGLQAPVAIWLEDRLVPHIRAQNDHDLYMAEGYIHAYFRLWQMDLQTRAAGGRVSEVVGPKALDYDRTQRRKGMVYAAENSLKAMEADSRTKAMLDAYTAGINAYIHSLHDAELPLEYKLMGFEPEDWTNLRTALLMKYMADDLTGASDDIAMTRLRDELSPEEFNYLYPERIKGSKPVIPEGTHFDPPSLAIPSVPGIPDSLFAHFNNGGSAALHIPKSEIRTAEGSRAANPESDGLGSNNWAISGAHTASGAPILCNDPHLGLNLPSLWFEIQLTAPGINTYGVSLPGAPGVVIGFNDSLSWGFTNNYRDVKDFYEIYPADENDYWFNGMKMPYEKRYEHIGVKGAADVIDLVLYTVHGPVFYDKTYPISSDTPPLLEGGGGRPILAMCWMAHRGTNELLSLYLLNRAQNYSQFVQAIQHFDCPAQNFVYADRQNNIAMWGQGQFINKWKEQGRFVMEGKDSLTLWGQDIPKMENPHVLNPPQGYVASANQCVTDSTYPYYYNGTFFEFRSWRVNEILTAGKRYSINDPSLLDYADGTENPSTMFTMQNDNLSILLMQVLKIHNIYNKPASWNGHLEPDSETSTWEQLYWYFLYRNIWQDEFGNQLWPSPERTMQILQADTACEWIDDINTPHKESFREIYDRTTDEFTDSLLKLKRAGTIEWYKVKNTTLLHLAKIPAFSYYQLKTGGWGNTINAMKEHHGPSWRMIVQMGKDSIEAYGVYPGGQSGNPGSVHYGDNIDKWVEGKYWRLLFIPAEAKQKPKEINYVINLNPEK